MSFQDAFKGKRVLVTGGARGIGLAVVKRLHSYGAVVYAVSKNPDNLSAAKEACPNVITIAVDLADWNATRAALSEVETVDCLVNNAGVYLGENMMDIKPENFDMSMNVNVKSLINVTQIFAKKMIDSGKSGTIVNVSSQAGRKARHTTGSYTISKAAVEHVTKAMAIELGPKKIRVNSICPGLVETDMRLQVLAHKEHSSYEVDAAKSIPIGQICMPMDDIVNTILFLLSDLTLCMTGESVAVDGGFLCT